MKYFLLLSLVLHRFSALAQLDTLQSKVGLETYLKRHYYYKEVVLKEVNLIIKDTFAVLPAAPTYWLKADFNHDNKDDLLIFAAVKKNKHYHGNVLLILLRKGDYYTKVDLIEPAGDASYSIYSNVTKSYLVINTLTQKSLRPQDMRPGHYFAYSTMHDTLFVQDNKPMVYTRHPTPQIIEAVKFSQTPCFGTCPVFQLSVSKDGSAAYKGIQYVNKIGDFDLIMSSQSLAYLTTLLAAIKPLNLNNHYSVDYTDAPTVYLTVRYSNGQTKTIEDYGGQGTYGLQLLYDFFLKEKDF